LRGCFERALKNIKGDFEKKEIYFRRKLNKRGILRREKLKGKI
jgi:hypothetical protein